jgi:hypothetical protein
MLLRRSPTDSTVNWISRLINLEEIIDGKVRLYRVEGAESWVSREEVEHVLGDAFHELVKKAVHRT